MELLRASNDHNLGRAYGLFEREGPRGTLSPRECQVLDEFHDEPIGNRWEQPGDQR